MPEEKDFLYGDGTYFSLSKLVGKKIADIIGYPSDPFGGTPVFVIFQIVFDDGKTVYAEGEHDVPYIPSDDELQNMDEDTLKRLS